MLGEEAFFFLELRGLGAALCMLETYSELEFAGGVKTAGLITSIGSARKGYIMQSETKHAAR